METNRDDPVIAAVRALGDDRVIAAVRAAKDAYAAMHGHDIAAIFEDVRALQEASGRTYVRDFKRLAQAATPIATQVSAAVRQIKGSLGPALERLNEWSAAAAPFLEKFERTAEAAAEAMERNQPALKQFHERKQAHDAWTRWAGFPTIPYPTGLQKDAETTVLCWIVASPITIAPAGLRFVTTWS